MPINMEFFKRAGNALNSIFNPDAAQQAQEPMIRNAPIDFNTAPGGFKKPVGMFDPEAVSYGIPQYNPRQSLTNSPVDILNQMGGMDHTREDTFSKDVDAFPVRKPPSTMRKWGAMLAGLGTGDLKNAQIVLDYKDDQRLADWKEKVGPSYQSANLERQGNINDRTLATQTATNILNTRKADQSFSINQKKNELAQVKMMLPDLSLETDADTGMVMGVDKKSGRVFNTGVKSTDMSDEEKLKFGLDADLQKIGATGTQQRLTEGVRQTGREALEGTRQFNRVSLANLNNAADMAQVEARGDTSRDIAQTRIGTPAQQNMALVGRVNQLRMQHPEWAKYITVNGNDVSIRTGWNAPPADIQKAITEALYPPDSGPNFFGGSGNPNSKEMSKVQRNTATGETRTVYSYDNGQTWGPRKN